jgi:HSP20 family protein
MSYLQSIGYIGTVWQEPNWQPPVDVYRTSSGWLVKVELAGVRIEDVEIVASDGSLSIRGARYDCSTEEVRDAYSLEIAYNRFERTLRLPCQIDPREVKFEYRDGMLLIRIPDCKTEERR